MTNRMDNQEHVEKTIADLGISGPMADVLRGIPVLPLADVRGLAGVIRAVESANDGFVAMPSYKNYKYAETVANYFSRGDLPEAITKKREYKDMTSIFEDCMLVMLTYKLAREGVKNGWYKRIRPKDMFVPMPIN